MSDHIEFRAISLENLDAVVELQVRPDQTNLVADNLYSIAQAGLDPSGWCRAAYLDGVPVGFFFVKELENGARVYLCHFMVHGGRSRGTPAKASCIPGGSNPYSF